MFKLFSGRRENLRLLDDGSFVSELVPIPFALTGTGIIEISTGWLYCNGATLPRTTYKRLFDEIGTDYNIGGEAGTDFRIPDFRGRSPLPHADGQVGTTRVANAGALGNATVQGAVGGAETVAVGKTHLPPHVHGRGTLAINGGSHGHGPGSIGTNLASGAGSVSGFWANLGTGTTVNLVPNSGAINFATHSHPTTDFSGNTEDGTAASLGVGSPTHNNVPPHVPGGGMVIRA